MSKDGTRKSRSLITPKEDSGAIQTAELDEIIGEGETDSEDDDDWEDNPAAEDASAFDWVKNVVMPLVICGCLVFLIGIVAALWGMSSNPSTEGVDVGLEATWACQGRSTRTNNHCRHRISKITDSKGQVEKACESNPSCVAIDYANDLGYGHTCGSLETDSTPSSGYEFCPKTAVAPTEASVTPTVAPTEEAATPTEPDKAAMAPTEEAMSPTTPDEATVDTGVDEIDAPPPPPDDDLSTKLGSVAPPTRSSMPTRSGASLSAGTSAGSQLDASGQPPIAGSENWWSCAHANMHQCSHHCCCDPGYTYQTVNSACNPEIWLLKNYYKGDVATDMLYTNCQGITAAGLRMPKTFGGLWWMDGNPAPETVASFGHALWYPVKDGGCQKVKLAHYTSAEKQANIVKDQFGDEVPCQGSMIVPFWEDRIWGMPDTTTGRDYAKVGTKANSNMEFVCGGPSEDDLTICKVGASTGADGKAWYKQFGDSIENAGGQTFNYFASFAMVKVNADYWIRYSLSDGSYPYYLKHIVNCDGSKGKYWDLYMSNGKGIPPRETDMYGHGGDTRKTVATVTDMQFVRWNEHNPPVGSGWTCATDTGGTCKTLGCNSWRGPTTCSKDYKCMCQTGYCEENGVCAKYPNKCSRMTGGTCAATGHCDWSRNAVCINGACMCKAGQCANEGRCPR